jgi:hypothetical protein
MGSDSHQDNENPGKALFHLFARLMGWEAIEAIGQVLRIVHRIIQANVSEGMYEVLEYEGQLELVDGEGQTAVFHKRQKVRFVQNNIIAYQDQAWGDGDIFADYRCSPGVEVDRYQEGHRWQILISLREVKNRGDVEQFHIQRTIRGGFTQPYESYQIEISHKTRMLTMSIVFPKGRHPKRVTLVEQNRNRSTRLGLEHLTELPDGRLEATWQTSKPRLFEAYILKWEW